MRTYGRLALRPADDFSPRPFWAIDSQPNVAMMLKRTFPRIKKHRKGTLTMVDTPGVARDLVWFMGRYPLEMDPADRVHLRHRAQGHRESERAVDQILAGHAPPLQSAQALPVEPYEEQWQAARIILATGELILGDEVGLGKTYASFLPMLDPRCLPALVVTPAHLQRQWLSELTEKMPFLRGHIIRTKRIYDPARRREFHGHAPDVLIISYPKLDSWADHLAGEVKYVVFEEAHELRHWDPRTRKPAKYVAAGQIADAADFKAGLSATPVYNYGGETHNVVSIFDRDLLGERSEFITEWGKGDRGEKTLIADPSALGRHLRDEGIFLRRKRKKAPPIKVAHLIDADEDQLREMTLEAVDLAEVLLAEDTANIDRRNAARDIDWMVRQATGIAKAGYVATFVEMLLESEDRVVLWGWHRAVYEIWRTRLKKYRPAMFTGSESPTQKDAAVKAFTAPLHVPDPDWVKYAWVEEDEPPLIENPESSRVLIMSLRAGAGLDGLQKVCNMGVFGELDWSPAMHDQCLGRVDPTRGLPPGDDATDVGSAVGYFLYTDHGSDPVVMDVLDVKRGQAEPLVDPDAKLFEATDTRDRVKLLAKHVLERRGRARSAA